MQVLIESQIMKIKNIIELTVPIHSTQRNSRFDFSKMNTSIVAVISDVIRNGRPLVGYAFNSFGRYGCGALLRERFIPKILDAPPESLLNDSQDNFDAQKIMNCLLARERAGGHAERSIPLGTIEVAVWDLIAKIQDRPLYLTLADFFNNGKSLAKVPCYVGGGWYFPGQTSNDLRQEMLKYLDDGYEMVKMKIGGLTMSEDVSRVETVLSVVSGGNNLAVDATCGFDRNRALAYAKALKQFELRWYEEPCDPMDFELYRELTEIYPHALATGENLSGERELQNFLRYSKFRPNLDIIQVDPPLSYGIGEYAKMMHLGKTLGFGARSFFPHGGNLMCLHVVAGLGAAACEAYTGVFGIFGGFGDEVRIESGYANLPESPGIGFERQPQLYEIMRSMT